MEKLFSLYCIILKSIIMFTHYDLATLYVRWSIKVNLRVSHYFEFNAIITSFEQ